MDALAAVDRIRNPGCHAYSQAFDHAGMAYSWTPSGTFIIKYHPKFVSCFNQVQITDGILFILEKFSLLRQFRHRLQLKAFPHIRGNIPLS